MSVVEAYDSSQQLISKKEHTPGHKDCPVCKEAKLVLYQALTPDLTFADAFDLWLSHRRIQSNGIRTNASYISAKTTKDYMVCAAALKKFFGTLTLADIHFGHLMEYQQSRAVCDRSVADWAKPAGANCIRKEIALLIRVLAGAGLWGDTQKLGFRSYRLRAVEADVPRAMTPEEQHHFLHIASSREEWQFVYWYAIVALQTTASTGELRKLRLGDILLLDGVIQIRRTSAKNKYRIRTIPLVSPDVCWALERLIERARELGSTAPHHYLFPIQEGRGTYGTYDPTRPMSEQGMKKRWNRVKKAANLPWLRPYDLRHTAITRLAEAGTPIQVIMSMAGHMTEQMQRHYTTVSLMSKRNWAQATWAGGLPRSVESTENPAAAAPKRFGPARVGAPAPLISTGTGPSPVRAKSWQG